MRVNISHGGLRLRRLVVLTLAVVLFTLSTRAVSADQCAFRPILSNVPLAELKLSNVPQCANPESLAAVTDDRTIGAGIIYLYANDEAKYSSLNNVLLAIRQLEGKTIQPGETFSFNQAAKLLEETIPYDLGPDVRNNLVKAGGVCMISTMLATAAHDAGLPFVDGRGKIIPRPVPHSRYYKYYHQINRINNRAVAITEAAVAIKKEKLGEKWQTVQDMRFINTSGRVLVLHFEASFTQADLDLSKPFGLLQQNHTLKVELRALPPRLNTLYDQVKRASIY